MQTFSNVTPSDCMLCCYPLSFICGLVSRDLFAKWDFTSGINFSIAVFPPQQWVGSSCGLHGPYIFYKAFKCHSLDGKPRILSLGDFFFVRCKPGDPICIAELQLLWEERTSKQLLSSSKLYFLPEDTPQGRSVSHGEVSMSSCIYSSAAYYHYYMRLPCCILILILILARVLPLSRLR